MGEGGNGKPSGDERKGVDPIRDLNTDPELVEHYSHSHPQQPKPQEPKSKHYKATKAEAEDRVRNAMILKRKQYPEHEIRLALMTRYGISRNQAMIYIRVARDRLIKELGRTKESLVAESAAYYQHVMTATDQYQEVKVTGEDGTVRKEKVLVEKGPDWHAKLKARKQFDELLFGRQATLNIRATNAEGEDILEKIISRMTLKELEVVDNYWKTIDVVQQRVGVGANGDGQLALPGPNGNGHVVGEGNGDE